MGEHVRERPPAPRRDEGPVGVRVEASPRCGLCRDPLTEQPQLDVAARPVADSSPHD